MVKKAPIWTVLWMMLVTAGIVQAQARQQLPPIPPEAVGWVGGVAYAVAVRDNYAYVGFGSDFTVVDVSNKTAPVVVATLPLPETIKEIHLNQEVAFVMLDMGLWAVDINNPLLPTILSSYLEQDLFQILVRNSYIYGIGDTYLKIWNASNPQSILLISILDINAPDLDWFDDFTIQGNMIYLMSAGDGQTRGVNVLDPSNPTIVSSWEAAAWSITSLGRSLFYYYELCTHYCTVWLSGWDVSNIYEPVSLGVDWMAPIYKSLYPYTMKGEGIYLYVGTDAAVFAYLPAQPAENGQVVMAYPLAHVRDLVVSQGYLWVASEQGLIIFEDLPHQKAFLPVHLR